MAKVDEEKVKFMLSDWIGGNVFWEKKNKYNYPAFQCDHLERPDMLIIRDDVSIAVEVKYASNLSNVLDGVTQTLRYARDGLTFYADHEIVTPNIYVLATQFSIKGHVFDFEKKKIPPSEGRDYAARMGEIPASEFRYTFMALRSLWRFAEYERDVHGWNWNVGVGFLLSNVLNNDKDISPLIQAKIDKRQFIKVI